MEKLAEVERLSKSPSSSLEDLNRWYVVSPEGSVYITKLNELKVCRLRYDKKDKKYVSEVLLEEKLTPKKKSEKFLKMQVESRKKYRLNPDVSPNFLVVGQVVMDDTGNLLFNLMSEEKTGFYRYSKEGKLLGVYDIDPNVGGLPVIKNNYLYMSITLGSGLVIYRGEIPK